MWWRASLATRSPRWWAGPRASDWRSRTPVSDEEVRVTQQCMTEFQRSRDGLLTRYASTDGLTAGEQGRDGDADFIDDIGVDELIEKSRATLAQDPLHAEGTELLYRRVDIDRVIARHQKSPARIAVQRMGSHSAGTGQQDRGRRGVNEQRRRELSSSADDCDRWRGEPAIRPPQGLLSFSQAGRAVSLGARGACSDQHHVGERTQVAQQALVGGARQRACAAAESRG